MIGMRDGCFRFRDVLEVGFRADLELRVLGKIGQRFGVTFPSLIQVILQVVVDRAELLFKERMEHDRGGAGVFHAFDVVDVFRKRRGRGDERRAQFKSEVSGR